MTLATIPRYERGRVQTVAEHAVVVGGSVAGLLASRILADRFETVTLVERDPLPGEPVVRRGVPQGRHFHVLLRAGRATLEDLFPGYGEDLLSAGGLMIDGATDVRFYDRGGYFAPAPGRFDLYCATRPLIEHVVRRRVLDRDGIEVRSECQVTDYLTDEAATTVEGVVVREGDGETELPADLVVDATGRTSRTPPWLEDHGYVPPPVDEVRVDLAYSSVFVERPPDDRRMLFVAPTEPHGRGGGAIPVEDDRWLVTLVGLHDEEPPTEVDEFTDYAARLPVPALEGLLDRNELLSRGAERYPFPSSIRRRYEDLDRFPDGLVVTGDAVASFNPLYGQGMSVAALEAVQLHHALTSAGLRDLPLRFFDRVEEVTDVAWKMAVSADFAFEETTGPKPSGTDLFNRYVSRLVRRAHTDGRLTGEFYRVIHMETPPTSLLRPSTVWRVLRPSAPARGNWLPTPVRGNPERRE